MTKIIATVGPMIAQEKELEKLTARNVMDFWVNTGLRQSHRYMRLLNRYKQSCSMPVKIFLDLPSTRCRHIQLSGYIEDDQIYKVYDESSTIEEDGNYLVMSGLKAIISDLCVGEKIYYEDGLCVFNIKEIDTKKLNITVVCDKAYDKDNQSIIKAYSSISFDGKDKSYDVLREADLKYLKQCHDEEIRPDYIVLSFCKNKEDVLQAKKHIKKIFGEISVLVKIQTKEAVSKIDSIIRCSDGVVIERGDLIYSLQGFSLPFVQKTIIDKARANNKISVVASGFMSEYARASKLSRAEQSDVYLLKNEGADYLLLTKETGQSDHPFATVDAIRMIFKDY